MIDHLEIHFLRYLTSMNQLEIYFYEGFFFLLFKGIPDAPTNVRLMVTGSNSITVTYDEPHRSNGAMVIKYKSMIKEFVSFLL